MSFTRSHESSRFATPIAGLRVLVALASYGTSNDHHLIRVIDEYRSMSFDVDIVVLSNIRKKVPPDVTLLAGLPNRDPWSLPFAHKQLFVDRIDNYDLFLYSEDDILITERNLSAFLEISPKLHSDEVAGFLRVEKYVDGRDNYPEIHGHFHWDATSITVRDEITLARFTNEHAACYALTQEQLRHAVQSGGFDVQPRSEERRVGKEC